jgi:hypothetical protein
MTDKTTKPLIPFSEPRHVNEIVEDTLQNLKDYSGMIADLSERVGEDFIELNSRDNELSTLKVFHIPPNFQRLVDWIQTFAESLEAVKIRISDDARQIELIEELENELLTLMSSMVAVQRSEQVDAFYQILKQKIPFHFQTWQKMGVPTLIHLKDN